MSVKRKSKPSGKSQPNSSEQANHPEAIPPAPLEDIKIGLPITLISLVILLLVIGVVWSTPRVIGDLFISLAGGRDVVTGRLGAPDTWSFVAGGRIWLNQNWGCDLLYYLVHHLFGNNGLLWLKAILISIISLVATLAARRRKVPWTVALLTAGLMVASARSFIDLRPNLMTLIFAPLILWLLYRTAERPSRIWLVVACIIIWANVHGGFIFGLGMIFLWAACLLIPEVVTGGMAGFKRTWQLGAGAVSALILTGIVTPFGWSNLLEPLVMLNQPAWRTVREWEPIWTKNSFGSIWEFVIVTMIIIILGLAHLQSIAHRKNATQQSRLKIGAVIFEAILAMIVIFMAVTSRRFTPMALLLMTPLLAIQVWWLIGNMRARWLLAVLGVTILIMAYTQFEASRRFYAPENPLAHQGTMFDKMNLIDKFYPVKLTRFVNDNHLNGNVFANWEWEGYLRWKCPQLKVFTGGRAQQIYRIEEFRQHYELLVNKAPEEILKHLNVHLVINSFDTSYEDLVTRLVTSGGWVYLYNDNRNCLLADPDWPQTSTLIARARQGRLIFRNQTDACLSQASFLLSPAAMEADHSQALGILEQVVKTRPLTRGYVELAEIIFADPILAPEVVRFFEDEEARLEKMSLHSPDGEEILNCRDTILTNLIDYYRNSDLEPQADQANQAFRIVQRDLAVMYQQWGTE